MVETFAFLVVAGLLVGLLAGLALGIAAFVRTARIAQLERRVEALALELARLQRAPARAPAAPGAAPVAEAFVATEPEPEPQAPAAARRPAPRPAASAEPEAPATPLAPAGESAAEPARAQRAHWERWLGVRGAALLGAAFLALAGLLFLQYSIQRGWVTPSLRVAVAAVGGVSALVASEVLRRRAWLPLAAALSGAGAVLLYGATWAAHALYGIYGMATTAAALPVMAAVTALCGWQALRHGSLVVALFGLAGGFATPLLLSLHAGEPLQLFGYLLLLDAGLIAVARRAQWPVVGVLGVACTFLLHGIWLLGEPHGGDALWGMAFTAAAALAFAFPARGERGPGWRATQVLAALAPLPFAWRYGALLPFHEHGTALLALLGALLALGTWTAQRQQRPWVGGFAALAVAASLLAASAGAPAEPAVAWRIAAGAALLALVPHAFVELAARRGRAAGDAGTVAWLAAGGLLACLLRDALYAVRPLPLPWLAGAASIGLLLVRQACLGAGSLRQILAAAGVGGVLLELGLAHGSGAVPLGLPAVAALLVALGAGASLWALTRRGRELRRDAWRAAALLAALSSCALAAFAGADTPGALPFALPVLALALLVAGAGAALGNAAVVAGAALLGALLHVVWARGDVDPAPAFAVLALAAAAFQLLPLAAAPRFARSRDAWAVAALAPALWLPALLDLGEAAFGAPARGLVPLGLAAVAAVALRGAAGARGPREADVRATALAWIGFGAAAWLALALPLQVERGLATFAPGLCALLVALLWRRVEHRRLSYAAPALSALATCGLLVRLVLVEADLELLPRNGVPLLNWIGFHAGVPALCALASARLLARHRAGAPTTPPGPRVAAACGVLGILLAFAWLNLEVVDRFQAGATFALTWTSAPDRDLVLSLAWAAFALALLVSGVRQRSGGLRVASLVFFLATIAKVFLLDLGRLEGLHRVASLIGLAFALLAVSVLYQRLVFRERAASPQV